jgi:WD40 repeat protein
MIQHLGPISGLSTFKNKWIATAGYDNQIILWDAKKQTALTCAFHDHLANQCQFSPSGDYLISSSSDGTARLWTLPNLKLTAVLSEHDDDVEMAIFHPTKNLIATASRDRNVRVFDFEGKLLITFKGHSADVISVEWDESGSTLLSSSDDGTVRRWDLATKKQVEVLDLGSVETDTLVVNRDGEIFAGNDDGEILYISKTHKTKIKAHQAGIKRLVYDRTKDRLVSLSYDRTFKVFKYSKTRGLELTASGSMPAEIWPRSCALLGDHKIIFATFGSTYAIYDLKNSSWNLENVLPTPGINAVCKVLNIVYTVGDAGIVKQDDKVICEVGSLCNFLLSVPGGLITGGQAGFVFDVFSQRNIYQHHSPLNCAASFTLNGESFFIVGSYTGEGIVFKKSSKGFQHIRNVKLHENAIKGVASDGKNIFSVCATGAIAYHSVESFKLICRLDNAHDKIANGCVTVSEDCFASISRDLKLRVWRGLEAEVIQTPHSHSIKCMTISSTKQVLATGSYNGKICLFDLKTRKWIKDIRPTTSGISMITANEQGFLASSYDGQVYQISETA